MKDLLKDKRVLIVGALLVLLVVGAGLFLFSRKPSDLTQNPNALPTQIPIPTITADSIGLTLEPGNSGRTVIVTIAKTDGIKAIDYELSYNSKGNIPRGAIGTLDLAKKPVSKEITLGTCSDVCHYDTEVSDIKLVLKITKSDGKVYQAQASLSSVSK